MEFPHEYEGGLFLKLENNETAVGLFRGNPYVFKQHYTPTKGYALCPGEGCEACKKKPPSFRFRINFAMKLKDGTLSPKIFEQGWGVYKQLKGLHGTDFNLEKTVVRLTCSANGNSKKKDYVITPLPAPLTPETEKILQALPLYDLTHTKKDGEGDDPSDDDTSDVPF